MKYKITERIVLVLTPETSEDRALLAMLESKRVINRGCVTANGPAGAERVSLGIEFRDDDK